MKEIIAALMIAAIAAAQPAGRFGKLTVIGDSIASGYGLEDYVSGNDYSAPLSFANLLGAEASEYENFAVDGKRSDELLELVSAPDAGLKKSLENADEVIISIGGNDILKPMFNAVKVSALTDTKIIRAILNHNFTPDMITEYSNRILEAALSAAETVDMNKTAENIRSMVERIEQINPDTQIILLTVYNPFAGNALMKAASDVAEQQLSRLNSSIAALKSDKVKIIDVHDAFKGHEAEFTNINKLDIHPSAEGHQKIYELLTE